MNTNFIIQSLQLVYETFFSVTATCMACLMLANTLIMAHSCIVHLFMYCWTNTACYFHVVYVTSKIIARCKHHELWKSETQELTHHNAQSSENVLHLGPLRCSHFVLKKIAISLLCISCHLIQWMERTARLCLSICDIPYGIVFS